MAIDFPSALPPQQATVAQIAEWAGTASTYQGLINGYQVRVSGDHHLSQDELDKIFKSAKTPSQAIFLMSSAALRKGHMLVSMQYAPKENVIYVHALQARVVGLKGGEISAFFAGLKDDPSLSRAEFDRARVIANVRSERTGIDYSVSYIVDDNNPERVVMEFKGERQEDYDATDLVLRFGNQGSRYVGRYFGDVGLSHNFNDGSRAMGSFETAFTDLGESRGGEDYYRIQLAADRPFAQGLYGISAGHTEYSQDFGSTTSSTTTASGSDPICDALGALGLCSPSSTTTTSTQKVGLNAKINTLGVSGEQVLASDLSSRLNLFERIDYIDSQIDVGVFGNLQDEKYATLELGGKYFSADLRGPKSLRWSAQLSLKTGLTGDSGSLGKYDAYQSQYLVSNPGARSAPQVVPGARTAEFLTVLPKFTAKLPVAAGGDLHLNLSAQFANEQLPQQQQWVLGGMGSMSAYLPGVLSGDSGYYGKLDYANTVSVLGLDFTPSVFVEYGAAWFENASGVEGDTRSIVDAGVKFSADLGWATQFDSVFARSLADDGFANAAALKSFEANFYFTLKKVF
ncbi:ShlB/FhaC/HecB family hemolysin secretion/activation protein [Zhongshania sp.]|jgi:hemolysin activation/secretion protein|uniref:ShlB/FhaC/HecB family hemolysin secretion/activation protein n=1 Tax=Zhongshania sp. TaxID=1971902 RepID=UPI0039E672C1